jgi:hypothetical protein
MQQRATPARQQATVAVVRGRRIFVGCSGAVVAMRRAKDQGRMTRPGVAVGPR